LGDLQLRRTERDDIAREVSAITSDIAGLRRLLARLRDLQAARGRMGERLRIARANFDAEIMKMILQAGCIAVTIGPCRPYNLHLSTESDFPGLTGTFWFVRCSVGVCS
jgi:hypothetical protein